MENSDVNSERYFRERLSYKERQLLYQQQRVTDDELYLAELQDMLVNTREQMAWYQSMAKKHLVHYNEGKQESELVAVEQYAELVKDEALYRKQLLADIKQQRDRVRWQRQKLQRMKEQNNRQVNS